MKKIVLACMLLIPLSAFAEIDFGVNVPEWQDFAPKAYIDVKAPKGLAKLNTNLSYWYDRRVAFETELEACRSLEANDERFNCYEKLKVSQYKMNNDYNARLEAKINGTSSVPGMGNPTDNMIPIGADYIQNALRWMPSEVR